MKAQYIVIIGQKESKFDSYDDAIDYAKIMTYDDEEHPKAIVITRKSFDSTGLATTRIESLTWLFDYVYVLAEIKL